MIEYTDNQKAAMELAADFVKKHVQPTASLNDEHETFPSEIIKHMGRLGLLGIPYPEKYGGAGLDYVSCSNVIREVATACASTAMTVIAHSILTGYPIFSFGSEDQKNKYLPVLLSGEKIGAFGLTEPNAGSDITSMESKAVYQDDHYVLNGSKIFITNANVADLFVVAAKTAPEKGMMGISLFVLESGMPGFTRTGTKDKMLGMRAADTGELIFQDVAVPQENLLGRKNFGVNHLHQTLVSARIGMAALALGISETAQADCLNYVKQRKQFGQTISQFQSIKNKLADMEVNINAARLLIHKAASLKDDNHDVTKEASEAKLFASEMATEITKDAVQIFGGYGYSRELPLERYFRDAKLTEIGDGTSEIQRVIIADEIIKRQK